MLAPRIFWEAKGTPYTSAVRYWHPSYYIEGLKGGKGYHALRATYKDAADIYPLRLILRYVFSANTHRSTPNAPPQVSNSTSAGLPHLPGTNSW